MRSQRTLSRLSRRERQSYPGSRIMASTIAAAKSTRIAIIGAGISGLSAAERLFKQGYSNIFILEATDRIGGRICTKNFGNGWVEIGAQWIHGEVDNSAYAYAIQHSLVANDKKKQSLSDAEIRLDNGMAIEESLVDKICDRFYRRLHEIREGVSKDVEQMTVESYIDRDFEDELNSSKCAEELAQKKALLEWCKYLQCSIDGCDSLSQLSLKSFVQYKECEGNPLIDFKKGFSSLIDSFTARIPSDMIHMCKPVVCVERMTPSHPVQYKTPTIKIKCQDGSTCIADHVVVTVSLGHLKQNASTMFIPPLSSEKLNAIQKLGFGTVDKIFIEFERAFWPKDSPGYSLAWRSKNSNSGSSKPWYQGIFGFYTVPFASNVLCGWISGAEAREMECLSEAEIKDTCIRVLQRFTGIANLPAVRAITRSAWHNNPYTRGSYSYFTPDQCSNSCLAEPITVAFGNTQCPVILFAGEATHPRYYSTVHGAMEAGRREADRIISYYAFSTKANL